MIDGSLEEKKNGRVYERHEEKPSLCGGYKG